MIAWTSELQFGARYIFAGGDKNKIHENIHIQQEEDEQEVIKSFRRGAYRKPMLRDQ